MTNEQRELVERLHALYRQHGTKVADVCQMQIAYMTRCSKNSC
jgi:hypothetical protein